MVMKRRTYLSGIGAALGSAAIGGWFWNRRSGVTAATGAKPEPAYTLLSGTEYATEVFVIEAPEPGPTALVVGGIHGDERSGYLAAEAVTRWQFDAGRVVVLPRANKPAIEQGTREGVGGDLNRKFPRGEELSTKLAQEIWNDVVLRHDPAVVVDLHRSKGIYKTHYDFVGQAIFPTDADDTPARAVETIEWLNDEIVPWTMPYHEFKRGNIMDGSAPLLAHKVAGALSRPAYIVETTIFLTDLDTRIKWTTAAAEHLLSLHGVERQSGGDTQ